MKHSDVFHYVFYIQSTTLHALFQPRGIDDFN